MSLRASAVLIAACYAAMQWLVLPPDGFVTGDQGSKFLQARAFADQGPLNPAIAVMARDVDPEYRRQEPKLKNRRGRLVSEFLWLLPMLSAPFVGAIGMRGLYVVPALSVIAIFFAAAALGRRLGDRQGIVAGWTVLLVTPAALYGLEFWEHAPAAACVLAAGLWLLPDAAATARQTRAKLIAAGAILVAGALFREEVAAALPAFLLARLIVIDRDRLKDLLNATVWCGVGATAVFLASVPMNYVIYGAPLPMHVTQDAWEVAKNTPYLQVRRDIVVDLLLPASHTAIYLAAIAAGLAGALLKRRAVVDFACVVLLIVAVALPLWRLATGVQPTLSYRVSSAAHTWPFVLVLFYWPWLTSGAARRVARYLVVSAVLLFLGSALLVPTSGGAQWSPRFMLAVAPLLAVVTACALAARPDVRRMAIVIMLASAVMQATGVVYFARAKRRHAEMTHWLASRTPHGAVLISTVFWFPELTATLASSRRFLFSWSPSDVPEMAAMAVSRGLPTFNLVTSPLINGYDAPLSIAVPGSPCRFTRGQQIALDSYGLTLSRYGCLE